MREARVWASANYPEARVAASAATAVSCGSPENNQHLSPSDERYAALGGRLGAFHIGGTSRFAVFATSIFLANQVARRLFSRVFGGQFVHEVDHPVMRHAQE